LRNFKELEQSIHESRIVSGNFQKQNDDQSKDPYWIEGKVGFFVFDGWFNGANTTFDISKVMGEFKQRVAKVLQGDYKTIFDRFDALLAFDTPPIPEIVLNRQRQEKLLEVKEGRRGMTDEQIDRIIQYNYIDSWDWENTSPIPKMEDVTFLMAIDSNYRIKEIKRGGHRNRWYKDDFSDRTTSAL
jgi:pantothenate kinase-related protein Tda10